MAGRSEHRRLIEFRPCIATARGFAHGFAGRIPCDADDAAGIGTKAAGKGQHFKEGLTADDLLDTGIVDGAEDGDGLAIELGNGDDDPRVLDEAGQVLLDFTFKLADGQAGSVDTAGEGQVDVATQIDAEDLIGKVLGQVFDDQGELIAGAQDIVGSGGRR